MSEFCIKENLLLKKLILQKFPFKRFEEFQSSYKLQMLDRYYACYYS